jgi:hypothetical protein
MKNSLPPPPKMGNGGSPPAHLPLSSLSNPEDIIDRAFDNFCQLFHALLQSFATTVLAVQELAKAADDCRPQEMAELRCWREALAAQESAEALAAQEAVNKNRCHAATMVFAAQESAKAADDRRCQVMTAAAEALAAQVSAEALAKERRCQEVAVRTAQASTEASEAAAHAAASAAQASTDKRPPQMVCRRVRPCRCTGCRNLPRVPSPINEALPSRPPPMWGGPSPLISAVPSVVARESATAGTPFCLEESAGAYSPPRSKTPSPLLYMTASPSPSLQLYDVTRVVSMQLDGGGAHPFRACGRTRRKLRPGRVCRRHGPRAPNLLEPLLCGRRHRPRAPNKCGGWA